LLLLGYRFEISESLVKVFANHAIHVGENTHGFHDVEICVVHGPGMSVLLPSCPSRYNFRQENTWFAFTSCRLATIDTEAAGSNVSSTIVRRFWTKLKSRLTLPKPGNCDRPQSRYPVRRRDIKERRFWSRVLSVWLEPPQIRNTLQWILAPRGCRLYCF
jgi:hypothetical protein